jgi:hypothetical protein
MPVTSCTTPVIVQGVVTFDAGEFRGKYPEFTGLTDGQLDMAFALAAVLLNPLCSSRVLDANIRLSLLYGLTAHIAFLNYGTNDGAGNVNAAPGIVGRISQATEGTVSVTAEFTGNGGPTQDWYLQSKYGAMYWVATSSYRTALYIPAPADCDGSYGPGFYGSPGCGC